MALKEGDILGDYRVIRAIGAGGMGAVYQTEHLITRRVEAMKVLSLDIAVEPDAVERFDREIQAQARLHHPNIVALYSAVRDGAVIGLVMEYIHGEPLARVLERGPVPVQRACAYARQLLGALAHAHSNGIVHGDVTPANILITPAAEVKLTDFGLGRSGGGVPAGTPWHMSPEQVRGLTAPDERSDIYAAGTVLYELLAGRKLFDAETPFEILRAHLDTVPTPPGACNRKVPAALDHVVLKALAKDPASRFQSAAEFQDAIDGAVSGGGSIGPVVWVLAASFLLVAAGFAGFARIETRPAASPPAKVAHETPAPAPTPTPAPEPVRAPEPVESRNPPPVTREPQRRRSAPAQPRERFAPPSTPPAVHQAAVELAPAPEPVPPDAEAGTPPPAALAEAAAPPIEEPKPEKTGNRFVRALGRLNPFRKNARKN